MKRPKANSRTLAAATAEAAEAGGATEKKRQPPLAGRGEAKELGCDCTGAP